MGFMDYEWHDAELKSIFIDRSHAGEQDNIVFEIVWPDKNKGKIIFEDVYYAELNLNFGVIALETIYAVGVKDVVSEPTLNILQKQWQGIWNEKDMKCYIFETASTASIIKIVAGKANIQ